MANLYANIAQLGRPAELQACLQMVTSLPAKLVNIGDYGIEVGNPADIVVLDRSDSVSAVAELAPPLFGMKRGRMSFIRPTATLHRPDVPPFSGADKCLTPETSRLTNKQMQVIKATLRD
jgi:cytosine deaminase